MVEEKELKQAQTVFDTLCNMLDDREWHYQKSKDDLTVSFTVSGDDLDMDFRVQVDAGRQLVILLSNMPFSAPESKREAMAVAVSSANNGMVDGNFDYDFLSGKVLFRMTSCYRESLIGKELFDYMIACACSTVDNYNDKFLLVAKKDMDIDEILEFVK